MKIILISVGTRGDMEPFIAIGELLNEKGHQVICAFPDQFRNLAEDSNLHFASLGSKFMEMLDSDDGNDNSQFKNPDSIFKKAPLLASFRYE